MGVAKAVNRTGSMLSWCCLTFLTQCAGILSGSTGCRVTFRGSSSGGLLGGMHVRISVAHLKK